MDKKWTKNFDNAPQVSQANLASVAHLTARQEHLVATIGKAYEMLSIETISRQDIMDYLQQSIADGLRTTTVDGDTT